MENNQKSNDQRFGVYLAILAGVLVATLLGIVLWQKNEQKLYLQSTGYRQSNVVDSQKTTTENQEEQSHIESEKIVSDSDPFDNFQISSVEKWKTYIAKNIGIEIKYPPELYLSASEKKVVFDYLSPTDPLRKHEGSVLARFNISLEQKTTEQYITEHQLNTLQHFKQEQVQFNNITADKITYTDAFAGGIMYKILIQGKSGLVVIDYAGSNRLEDTFNSMFLTVRKI